MLRGGARAPPHPQGKADRVSPVLSDAQFLASVREFAEGFERMPRGELYRLAQLMGIGGASELADMARGLKVEADARIDRGLDAVAAVLHQASVYDWRLGQWVRPRFVLDDKAAYCGTCAAERIAKCGMALRAVGVPGADTLAGRGTVGVCMGCGT